MPSTLGRMSERAASRYYLTGETFDALVTGASSKGTWVRLLHPPVEGRVVHGEEGLDVEFVQVGGTLIVPALLSGEVGYTTVLSAVGTHAANGGPSRIVH